MKDPEDMTQLDMVIEGDAIGMAHRLAPQIGGRVRSHARFGYDFEKTNIKKIIDLPNVGIRFGSYYDDSKYSAIDVLNKLGGILYNRKHDRGFK